MKKQTVAFSKNASNLFFHILTKCNLSCRHCYINKEQHGGRTLDIDTIRQWLRHFADRCSAINVIFLGGEPTLHPDLSLAVKEARKLNFKSVTIDTNGYLFHNILDRITPEDVDFISFSLDGATRETNDAIRGEGCWDACLAGARKASSMGFSTSMIYTVSNDNIHELSQMPALVEGLGIRHFFIQVVGIRGESADTRKGMQVTRDAWLTAVPEVAESIAAKGITVTWPKVFLSPDEPFQCAGLVADNYFIFPNGRVYRCPICEDFPVHSLEIGDQGLTPTRKINEQDLFGLSIPEGCVMNKLVQPGNITYDPDGSPEHRIACCLLKQELRT